jgi:hypothetical protein
LQRARGSRTIEAMTPRLVAACFMFALSLCACGSSSSDEVIVDVIVDYIVPDDMPADAGADAGTRQAPSVLADAGPER